MLKSIPPLLGPDLLATLRAMGHGDEIAIVDANYPASFAGPRLLRADGVTATDMLEAILTVLPLDDFVNEAAIGMAVVEAPERREPIHDIFAQTLARHAPEQSFSTLERFAFYARVKAGAAIVQTGESRLYGNIILKKGVIRA